MIVRQPADNERNTNNALTSSDVLSNSRTGVRVTDVDPSGISDANRLMRCSAYHVVGTDVPPSIVWTRDGEEVVVDGTHIITTTSSSTASSDEVQSNLQINDFGERDAAIYQCIFTDSAPEAAMATSMPHRLDYGACWILVTDHIGMHS